MRGPREAHPPRGVECIIKGWGARGARPARHPRRTGGDTGGHPIAPTKPLSAGPLAGVPARSPGRAGAGCGIRPSGGGSGPRGQRRRTADPTGRLPPGIWFQAWPAAIRPQTPAVPEAKGPPGFRRHRGTHAGRTPRAAPKRLHRSAERRGGPRRQTIFPRGWCRARGSRHTRPREGIRQAGKKPSRPLLPGMEAHITAGVGRGDHCCRVWRHTTQQWSVVEGEALPPTSTHTLRPSLGGRQPCNRSVPETRLEYVLLLWENAIVARARILPIVSGPVYMGKSRPPCGLRNFEPTANWRVCPPTGQSSAPTGESSHQLASPPPPGGACRGVPPACPRAGEVAGHGPPSACPAFNGVRGRLGAPRGTGPGVGPSRVVKIYIWCTFPVGSQYIYFRL